MGFALNALDISHPCTKWSAAERMTTESWRANMGCCHGQATAHLSTPIEIVKWMNWEVKFGDSPPLLKCCQLPIKPNWKNNCAYYSGKQMIPGCWKCCQILGNKEESLVFFPPKHPLVPSLKYGRDWPRCDFLHNVSGKSPWHSSCISFGKYSDSDPNTPEVLLAVSLFCSLYRTTSIHEYIWPLLSVLSLTRGHAATGCSVTAAWRHSWFSGSVVSVLCCELLHAAEQKTREPVCWCKYLFVLPEFNLLI